MFETAHIEAHSSDYETERGKPMPSKHHSFTQTNLILKIGSQYSQKYRLGSELSLDLPERERVPDLVIYPSMPFGEEEVKMSQIPLGVIEILSPTQNHVDLMQKKAEYFRAGVKSYWLVFPDLRSVYVYYSVSDYEVFGQDETLLDKVLNIEVSLPEIFS